jgi:ATP-dependent Lhr-like helicase
MMLPQQDDPYFAPALDWFDRQGWTPFPFQLEAWQAYRAGLDGLVNAPTGSGKTYALMLPILLAGLAERKKLGASFHQHRDSSRSTKQESHLRAIWITPIRALTREIQAAGQRAADDLGLDWRIAIRSGDTSSHERTKQKRQPPEVLITTPESLHLLLASKDREFFFSGLRTVVVDEWHELIGSKRGVLVELALSRLRGMRPQLRTWGISATIGNLPEAAQILLGRNPRPNTLIRSRQPKALEVISVLPDEIETFPWAGHLGIKLLQKILPIIHGSQSTLIFTNTRAQCEIWYQRLLEADPDLAGRIAMHHGSLSRDLRDWVEDALHEGTLKAVVCTSSLDLGVDFRPVETVVQIGSPKGVARFVQRAGRSGHRPGQTSRIYFVPTHSLELIEGAGLRAAITEGSIEQRLPYLRSFDVLLQYLVTLAVGGGFRPPDILPEVRQTYSYYSVSDAEWAWCLDFITTGGNSLGAYDEYQKVEVEDGLYRVTNRRTATMHRLGIGAIVSESTLVVKYLRGGTIGSIEEFFVSQLKPGDTFWFAGRSLELIRIKDMTVQVRKSRSKKGKIPSWLGGRLPLSGQLATYLRGAVAQLAAGQAAAVELTALEPLAAVQARRSYLPAADEFLIEYFQDREGYHLLMYPFEGRFVHEGLGALVAYRLSRLQPISFSIAMNDYGFELLSDVPIPIEEGLGSDLFSVADLAADIDQSINAAELARRRFRDIAAIAGLVFKGYPGKQKREKHLQSSSQLFFDVFSQYEPDNLLLQQAYEEVMTFQLEEARLRAALERINRQKIRFSQPPKATPFSFPIIVDRLRERLSSEKLEDRVARMRVRLIE